MALLRLIQSIKSIQLSCGELGYTLLEILLVIAILGILSTMAISTYRRHSEQFRLEKVAMQIQQVLQAAAAYYLDQRGTWPDSNDNIDLSPGQNQCNQVTPENPFVKYYLPNANLISDYGAPFCWSSAGEPGKPRLFWVAIAVPHQDAPLAQRLAGELPNAITTSDPSSDALPVPACNTRACYVRAMITQPQMSGGSVGGGFIQAMGTCPDGGVNCVDASDSGGLNGQLNQKFEIQFKACPAGFVPKLSLATNGVYMPYAGGAFHMVTMNTFSYRACEQKPNAQGNEICFAQSQVEAGSVHKMDIKTVKCNNAEYCPAREGLNYMVVCMPSSPLKN